MSISLKKLRKLPHIDTLIVQSLQLALYQLMVVIDGKEHLVKDEQNRIVRARNFLQLQKLVDGISVGKMLLRHMQRL